MAKIEEILCEAIDTIVEKRIKDLHYDITKSCTIIDDQNRANGEYIVSDGSVHLEVYSTNTNYRKGDNVLVNIPNGDFNMQKTIVAKLAETSKAPFSYTSPLDTMIKVKDAKEVNDNITLNKKEFVPFSASVIGSVSYTYYKSPIGEGYDTTKSTNNFYATTKSSYVNYIFNLSSIPRNVKIKRVSCKIKGKSYSTVIDENRFATCQLYSGDRPKGTAVNFTKGTTEVIELESKDFTRSQLDNLALRFSIGTSYYGGGAINGATLYVEYNMIGQDEDTEEFIHSECSLLSNDENKITYQKIYESTNMYNLDYTRLGITADFQSWFNNEIISKGSYGLKIYLYEKENEDSDNIYELNFNSSEMFGNPYNFETYFTQEKVFDISDIPNFYKISVYFYQANDFYDENNLKVPYTYSMEGINQKYPNNLFVSNLNIFYGYDSKAFSDDRIVLYNLLNDNYYDLSESDENNTKTFGINWIHKINNNNDYCLITENENDLGTFEINWFTYDGKTLTSPYAGIGWKELEEVRNDFYINFVPDKTLQQNKVKVVGIFKPKSGEAITVIENEIPINSKGQRYYSNVIILDNKQTIPSTATLEAISALQIQFNDGTNGNYFLYDQNGRIVNDAWGSKKLRTLSAKYQGEDISNSIGNIESLTWYIPYPNNDNDLNNEVKKTSMILPTIGTNTSTKEERNQSYYQGLNYRVYTLKPNEEGRFENLTYAIYDLLTPKKVNNTIHCVLKMNGVTYEATKELMFAKIGTNGSNLNFMLNFNSNENGIYMDGKTTAERKIQVKALLFDSTTGEPLGIDTSDNKLIWSWKSSGNLTLSADGEYCTVTYNGSPAQGKSINNYHILKCVYKYSPTLQLEAYLPIPLKLKGYSFIEGAKEITYNHQGIPYYYKYPYRIFSSETNEEVKSHIGWELRYDNIESTNNNINKNNKVIQYLNIPDTYYNFSDDDKELRVKLQNYLPTLKTIKIGGINYCSLCAPSLYLNGYQDKICVNCLELDDNFIPVKTLWSQPILITQSSYDFTMLNNWDGTLQLDENNGTIMSTMLGAGKKNSSSNTFSGVLIGDIQTGTGLNQTETLTGVYGIKDGVLSYGLREDGTAFLGRKGHGQILFDGEKSEIKSSLWDAASQGLFLNLDQGIIDSKGESGQRFYLNPKSESGTNSNRNIFQLLINGKDSKPLININSKASKEEYYIQSIDYNESSSLGTKFDLANGTLKFYSGQGGLSLKSSPETNEGYFNVFTYGANKKPINLIQMGNNDYYLQSKSYTGQKQVTDTTGNYNVYKYTRDDLGASTHLYNYSYTTTKEIDQDTEQEVEKITSISSVLVSYNNYIGVNYKTSPVDIRILQQSGENYYITGSNIASSFKPRPIYNNNNIVSNVIEANNRRQTFLANLNAIFTQGEPKGLKIDLENGIINGYDMYLKGTSNNKGSLIIDSTASEYPFVIRNKDNQETFKLKWDGELICNKVISLNNDGRTDRPISISNNFYVDQGGNLGATAANIGSGWFGGTASLANNAKKAERATLADSATRANLASALIVTDTKSLSGNALDSLINKVDTCITGSGTAYHFNGVANGANSIIPSSDTTHPITGDTIKTKLNLITSAAGQSTYEFNGMLKGYEEKQITSTDGQTYTVLGK